MAKRGRKRQATRNTAAPAPKHRRRHAARRRLPAFLGKFRRRRHARAGRKDMTTNLTKGLLQTGLGVAGFMGAEMLAPMFTKDKMTKSLVSLGAGLALLALMRKNMFVKYAAAGIAMNGGLSLTQSLLTPAVKAPTAAGDALLYRPGTAAPAVREYQSPRLLGINASFAGTGHPGTMMGAGSWSTPMSANRMF